VDQDRGRFIKTLLIGIAAAATLIVLGIFIQNTTGFPLPQGVCVGILLLFVLVPLFRKGQQAAIHHNFVQDSAGIYNARQRGNDEAQLERNQDLRNKGLISEQEYDSRKDGITSKK